MLEIAWKIEIDLADPELRVCCFGVYMIGLKPLSTEIHRRGWYR